MLLISNTSVESAGLLIAGVALGFGFFLWRERKNRTAFAEKEEVLLENSRKEAEAMLREARLIANEEVLKLRDQTDQSLSKRRLEIEEAEKRLAQTAGE